MLVVCEGEKTEPSYFAYYKRKLRLSNVALEICGEECGSDPLSVVEYALRRMRNDKSIDECYCIIDRNGHPQDRYLAALAKAKAADEKWTRRDFKISVSDPCIEYWFLLHFEFVRAPFEASGGRSRGECAVAKLKDHWPEYQKKRADIGEHLSSRFPVAEENAIHALEDAENTGELNPSTTVHVVVKRLLELNG